MLEIIPYDFAKEFSPYPGPRWIRLGPNSGEKFRNEVLDKMYDKKQPILIDPDGAKISYGPSFLSEAFGQYALHHTIEDLNTFIKIKDDTPNSRRFKKRMMSYVEREIEKNKK